jgi:hypothetical protein
VADTDAAAASPPVDPGDVPDKDRPVEEPEGATQQDQLDQLRDTGNARKDQTESEEAELLEAEFGQPNADGIYGGPADGADTGAAASGAPAAATDAAAAAATDAAAAAPAAEAAAAPPGGGAGAHPTTEGEEGKS